MYKYYSEVFEKEAIVSEYSTYKETCFNPTIFEWTDVDGDKFLFRLSNGQAKLVNETTRETILSGSMDFEYAGKMVKYDSITSFDDMVMWAKENGIIVDWSPNGSHNYGPLSPEEEAKVEGMKKQLIELGVIL